MTSRGEIIVKGRAVSRGVAVGNIVCLYGTKRQFVRRTVDERDVAKELERFEKAQADSGESIAKAIAAARQDQNKAASEILLTHKTILDDPSIRQRIIGSISRDKTSAEWAVFEVFQDAAAKLRDQSDETQKEKHLDFEDVCEHLLVSLGAAKESIPLPPGSIVAATEVSPAMFLDLAVQGIRGLIAESGGWTSHTSILAREAKIPAITGIRNILETFGEGESVAVDGFTGEAIIDPSDATCERIRHPEQHKKNSSGEFTFADRNISTLDGIPIIIRTNTGTVESYENAEKAGAKGIGLFRSEAIIDTLGRIPNEDEQAAFYSELAKATGEYGVSIRTFDIDESVLEGSLSVRKKNPALGLRAIRLGLAREELLRTQICALLRAAYSTSLSVVVPMVSGTAEIRHVRQIIDEESERLRTEDIKIKLFELGAMVEVPSAVLVADQLAKVCDFLCLGTNDLAQYLLAADRDNESVSKWFRTLHPAMIRSVKRVIDECRKAKKPLVVCGEMAGSPFYVPVLIGLGATEFSVSPATISDV
ncbi:MAG: phosphoenolpyruvate--protein phosphotransferase, partial [Pyrinomonadaceae bacterium]